jgi:hypothetical protein
MAAIGAHEAAHVLDDADDWRAGLLAERDLLSDIRERHFLHNAEFLNLWRGHDNRSIARRRLQVLHDTDMLIGSAGRRVDQQEIDCAPLNIGQELPDESVLPRPTPNHSIVLVVHHEPNRHHTFSFR